MTHEIKLLIPYSTPSHTYTILLLPYNIFVYVITSLRPSLNPQQLLILLSYLALGSHTWCLYDASSFTRSLFLYLPNLSPNGEQFFSLKFSLLSTLKNLNYNLHKSSTPTAYSVNHHYLGVLHVLIIQFLLPYIILLSYDILTFQLYFSYSLYLFFTSELKHFLSFKMDNL